MKYEIFTDGSCAQTTKLGGCGLVVIANEQNIFEKSIGYSNTTNNRMEMTALINAFEYICNNGQEKDEVIFYVDNAYIVNCFEQKWYLKWRANGWRTSNRLAVKNQDKWKELFNLCRKCERANITYSIKKIAAHQGNKWNEYADRLANNWRGLYEEDLIIDKE